MRTDRFGNVYAPTLPYARGQLLTNTEDDFRKCQQAWRHIAARVSAQGLEAIFNLSGLEHGLPPGTSALLVKFIPPETLKRFGGAQTYAKAIDACLDKLAGMLAEPEQIRRLLLGDL